MPHPQAEAVTVVIPSHNAAATIDETLRSVRAQTHTALEILVVDDGSQDTTADVVKRHTAQDSRVRLIRQANAGVAAARNRGIAEASAALIAPVDADDLWHPHKIELQLQALRDAGEQVALVYTWSALIDEHSHIISLGYHPQEEGDVLHRMCLGNLVGNGSSTLMRKAAVLEAGGYNSSLRARNAQGCEDYELYLKIALRHHFALVQSYLTGYRQTATNMSSDIIRMLRSFDLVTDAFSEIQPEMDPALRKGRQYFLHWSYSRAVLAGRWGEAARVAYEMLRWDRRPPLITWGRVPEVLVRETLLSPAKRMLNLMLTAAPPPCRFPIGQPVSAAF